MTDKTIGVKELKDAAEILGTHTRDLLNANIDLKNRIAYFERLRDAVATASQVVSEGLMANEKATAELERIQSETATAQKKLSAVQKDLAPLQEQKARLSAEIESRLAVVIEKENDLDLRERAVSQREQAIKDAYSRLDPAAAAKQ